MDEFDGTANAPLIVEMIGGMHAGTEINKSMGPYQLVVNIVLFVILQVAVSHAKAERIGRFPPQMAKERAIKLAVQRHRVAQTRIVIHLFGLSPCRVWVAM